MTRRVAESLSEAFALQAEAEWTERTPTLRGTPAVSLARPARPRTSPYLSTWDMPAEQLYQLIVTAERGC